MPAKKKDVKTTAKVEKKVPAKKATVKKVVAKKPTAKKTTKKVAVEKQTLQKYIDVINWKKWEAHHMGQLYIEVNANDLLTEIEAGVDNMDTCCNAILDCMLEGDSFIVEPKAKNKVSKNLTVRYYCDNLSEDRRKYSEVN